MAVNAVPVASMDDLFRVVASQAAGSTVTVSVIRDAGDTTCIEFTVLCTLVTFVFHVQVCNLGLQTTLHP